MKEQKQKEEEERRRWQGRRGPNRKRRNERESIDMNSRRNKNERGGGGGRGSEEAISTREEGRANLGYWNPRRGRGEERKDKGGYPDKARKNHGKVQDYCHKEMIRMKGLPATTRTR